MKKAFLMVLACLLLAGCGAPSETVTPTDSGGFALVKPMKRLLNPAGAYFNALPIPPATAPAEPLPPPPW
ncbi:MAG: hypothetical protein ACLSSX_08615 [Dysosmobacter sp.]